MFFRAAQNAVRSAANSQAGRQFGTMLRNSVTAREYFNDPELQNGIINSIEEAQRKMAASTSLEDAVQKGVGTVVSAVFESSSKGRIIIGIINKVANGANIIKTALNNDTNKIDSLLRQEGEVKSQDLTHRI